MKFHSPEEEKNYFENAIENRRKIKGDVTFQPPQFYNNTYWNATFNRLNDGGLFAIFSNITQYQATITKSEKLLFSKNEIVHPAIIRVGL